MDRLSKDWIIEPVFDYEYKTYQALGYLHRVSEKFDNGFLFPYLTELKWHCDQLDEYRKAALKFEGSIRTELLGLNLEEYRLIRKKFNKNEALEMVHRLLEFAGSRFITVYNHGLEEKRNILSHVNISPVGLLYPKRGNTGLFFIEGQPSTRVYEYTYRFVQRPNQDEAYKDVMTTFLGEVDLGMFPNYSDLKLEYIRKSNHRGDVNTYLVETDIELPAFETLVPMVKEFLLRQR